MNWHKLRLILLYGITLFAILSAVLLNKASMLARSFDVHLSDMFSPLPTSMLSDDAITVLLLGIGGKDHEGPDLTDSITLIRYTPGENSVRTLGIPRDLWDPESKDKVNSIYTYALQQDEESPFSYVKEKFNALLQNQIDYVVVIDFNDFTQLIDLIGGIQVHINAGFVDSEFPKDGFENADCVPYDPEYSCRYETLVFRAGDQKLNGDIALKFVRSRHASGNEGSDFARSKRQQMVIGAIRSKLIELVHKRDFDTISKVLAFAHQKVKRDITNKDALAIGRTLMLSGDKVSVVSNTLDEDVFEVPPLNEYENRYVLVPSRGDFDKLQTLINKKLSAQ
ncbi:LCP family protein [Candidatus Woesebacteria bacterium]|nr:LCP family protein [Candidatus Woesebacteria bacterium]